MAAQEFVGVNLREFVARTLQEVVLGAVDAQEALGDHVQVNPVVPTERSELKSVAGALTSRRVPAGFTHRVHPIEFSLNVTATASSDPAKLSFSLKVVSGGLGVGDSQENRIGQQVRFTIPLVFDTARILSERGDRIE